MKKLLSLLLAVLCLLPALAAADAPDWSAYTSEELEAFRSQINAELASRTAAPEASPAEDFVIVTDGTQAIIRQYNGSATELVIPSEYDGLPVTQIGDKAFYHNETLVSVYIPGSVTLVGKEAFRECKALASVTFGDSTGDLEIGSDAFHSYYQKLTEIRFSRTPYRSLTLKGQCFRLANMSGTLVLNAETITLGQTPFARMMKLEGLVLLADTLILGESMLHGSGAVQYVYISPEAELSCGMTYNTGYEHFTELPECTAIFLPDSVTGLTEKAFANDPKVTVYCRAGSGAEAAAKTCLVPVSTADYEAQTAPILSLVAEQGFVY